MDTPGNLKTKNTPSFDYMNFRVPGLSDYGVLLYSDSGFHVNPQLVLNHEDKGPLYIMNGGMEPLVLRSAFYTIGRDLLLMDAEKAERLAPEVRMAAKSVYRQARQKLRKGAWHGDCFVFIEKPDVPKGILHPSDEGYMPAWCYSDVEKVVPDGDGYKIETKSTTTETFLWLPPGEGRFIVPTKDGTYHPVTGTPFETVKDRKEAKKRWVSMGLSDTEADMEISRFYRELPKDRKYGISCSLSGDECGPFGISIRDVRMIEIIMLECD